MATFRSLLPILLASTAFALSACGSKSDAGPGTSPGTTACSAAAPCTGAKSYCGSDRACHVDATPPAVAFTAPAAGALLSTAQVTVAGTVSDGESGVATAELSTDGTTFAPLTLSGGAFSADVAAPRADGASLEVTVRATDGAGNTGTATRTVRVDGVAPALAVAAPLDAAAFSGATFTLSGTASDGSGVVVEWAVDGGAFTTASVSAGAFSVDVPVPAGDAASHTLAVRARDPLAHQTVVTRTFTSDRVPPALAVTSPAADGLCTTACTGGVVALDSPTYTLSGTVSDAGLASVTGTVLDGAAVVASGPAAVGAGSWSWTWSTLPAVNGKAYTFRVDATDALGNASSATRSLIVDRVPASLTFSEPTPGRLVGGSRVAVAGSANDGAAFGLAAVSLSLDGVHFTPVAFDAGGAFATTLALPAGADHVTMAVTARVLDLAGNPKDYAVSFAADNVPPLVTITSPGADFDCTGSRCVGAVVNLPSTAAGSYVLTGTASDGGGFASLASLTGTVLDAGVPVAGPTSLATSPWTFAWPAPPADAGKAYDFVVTAVDAAGNSASATRKLWVDRVAPTVALPASGARLLSRTAPLLTFSEPMDVASVVAATTFTPAAVSAATYGSADGVSFSFTDPAGLAAYTSQTLAIGTGALDRSGNPLAAARSERFLTEPFALAFPAQVQPGTAVPAPGRPRLVVDGDGKPIVAFAQGPASTSGAGAVLAVWDGKGQAFAKRPLYAGSSARAVDLEITAAPRNADLTISPAARALLNTSNGTGGATLYAESADLVTWTAFGGTGTPLVFLAPVNYEGEATFAAPLPVALVNHGPDRVVGANSAGVWGLDVGSTFTATVFSPTPAAPILTQGSATLDAGVMRFYDQSGTSSTVPAGAGETVELVNGQPQSLGSVYRCIGTLGCLFVWDRVGSGWLAYVESHSVCGTKCSTEFSVHAACTANAGAATPVWTVGAGTPFATGLGTIVPAQRVATAVGAGRLAVAVQDNAYGVSVYTAPDDACATSPVLTRSALTLTSAKDPAVAVDAGGAVWVAYISTVSGDLLVQKMP